MTKRQSKPHPRYITYWTEKARAKMKRWVHEGADGRRLAQLGVPLNMMTTEQRAEAEARIGQWMALPRLNEF